MVALARSIGAAVGLPRHPRHPISAASTLLLWLLLLPAHISCATIPATPAPIVVAGAGPASLLFAMRCLDLDPSASIAIYEKRPRPQTSSAGTGVTGFQAFGFGLGGRAKRLFGKVPGLSECIASVKEDSRTGMWFVNHQDMCAAMIDELQCKHGVDGSGRLRICFEAAVASVNDDCSVVVETKDGDEERVPYSLLVAADGMNSAIRTQLVQEKLLRCSRYMRNVAWKALKLPKQPKLTPGFAQMYGQSLGNERSSEFGGLLPRFKHQFVLLMFWRRDASTTQTSPFGATTPAELKARIAERFPDVTAFPDDAVVQEFLDDRPGKEVYMKLNKHALPKRRIALIGDAAVGMYSRLGQGVTSGMERADLLAATVAEGKDNLPRALRSFSKQSVREGHAITDLNLMDHAWDCARIKVSPMDGMMAVAPLLNNPDLKYSELKKRFWRWIFLGRLVWRFQRLPDSLESNN